MIMVKNKKAVYYSRLRYTQLEKAKLLLPTVSTPVAKFCEGE